jgi:apolipoprotein N-acyltransferase
VTAHVDALGRIVARAPRETRMFLLVRPALLDDTPTLYVRFGDLLWLVPLGVALGVALLRRAGRETRQNTTRPTP